MEPSEKKKKHLHKKKESNENINEKGFMFQKSQKPSITQALVKSSAFLSKKVVEMKNISLPLSAPTGSILFKKENSDGEPAQTELPTTKPFF